MQVTACLSLFTKENVSNHCLRFLGLLTRIQGTFGETSKDLLMQYIRIISTKETLPSLNGLEGFGKMRVFIALVRVNTHILFSGRQV